MTSSPAPRPLYSVTREEEKEEEEVYTTKLTSLIKLLKEVVDFPLPLVFQSAFNSWWSLSDREDDDAWGAWRNKAS